METLYSVMIGFVAGVVAVAVFAVASKLWFNKWLAPIGLIGAYCVVFWIVFILTATHVP